MTPIRIRTANRTEQLFANRRDLTSAIVSGEVTATCEVFHVRANRWLPVTRHPAWPSVAIVKAEAVEFLAPTESDLIFINPDFLHDLVAESCRS